MKFGIIGTNFVSDMFMSGASHVQDVEVTGVCSGRYENALKFKEKYQIAHVYKNYQEMLEDKKIDAVYIATPNSTHYEISKYCLKKGYPVFCEKPFMVNDRQAKEIFELAESKNLYIHDGIVPLYTRNLQILKDNIKKIGTIRKAILSFGKYSSRYKAYLNNENPTTFRKELANGSMMDLGVYVLADAVALFGKPNEVVSRANLLKTGVDASGTVILIYDEFDVVLLHSKVSDTLIVSEIQGEDGIIQIGKPSLMEDIYLIKNNEKTKISMDEESSFAYQIKDFVNSVNKLKESKAVSHQLTLDILETLTKARKLAGIIYDYD